MTKRILPTNIQVSSVHLYGDGKCCISWEIGEHRYHIWSRRNGALEGVLYKNPLHREKDDRRRAKHLDVNSIANARMIQHVSAFVVEHNVMKDAFQAEETKQVIERRITAVREQIKLLKEEVLATFCAGQPIGAHHYARYTELRRDIAELEKGGLLEAAQ